MINVEKIKRIFYSSNMLPLHKLLNLWAIEDGAIIGLDLQMTYIYEITPPDLNTIVENEVDQFFLSIKNTLHSLPENATLTFIFRNKTNVSEELNSYSKATNPDTDLAKLIVDSKLKHFENTSFNNRSIYMFITIHPDKKKFAAFDSSFFKIVNVNYKKITNELHYSIIKGLKEAAELITGSLLNAGILIQQLSDQESLNYIYEYLNPGRKDIVGIKEINPATTLRSQVCFNACEPGLDNVYMDGYYYRTINILTRPESAHYSMVYNLYTRLEPDYDLVFTVSGGNQEELFKNISFNKTIARNISSFSVFKKNYEAEAKADESEDLMEVVKNTHQKLFVFSMCCILRDRTLEDLTTRTNIALQAFRDFGQTDGIIDDVNHLQNFLTVLPGHSHLNFRKHIFQSDAITQMLPLSFPWKGCKTPKLLFQTDENSLLPIDLFDPALNAKHAIVIGTTGSGKSFSTNFLLSNFLIESPNNHVVIIDVGGSYRKLCDMFGGQYLDIDLSGDYCFNPFPPREEAIINASDDEFELDPEISSFLCQLIQKMLKKDEISGREEHILSTVVKKAYKHKKFSERRQVTLSSLRYHLEHYEGDEKDKIVANEFVKNLEPWFTGEKSKVINRESSIPINSRLVVFDLQKLDAQPDLQSIIFFVIKNVIYSKLKDLSLKKYIVIDEGWKFFNDKLGSKLIMDLYRTARKFNGAVLSISQSPLDFLKTEAADSIISNSPIKYVLRLNAAFEALPKFQLNEKEIEKIKDLTTVPGKYSEVFLKFGGNSTVLRIQPSPTDYWVCTTDPDDYNAEQKMREKYPDYSQAGIIKKLAAVSAEE